MPGSAFEPTIISDPACGTEANEPNSTTKPGTFEWVVQAQTDPRNTISVEQPIRGRLLDMAPGEKVIGETYEWNGAWILFAAYGGSVGYAGDILYLPMGKKRDYTVEFYQLAEGGAASDMVRCTIHVDWDRTQTGVQIDNIQFRAWDEDYQYRATEQGTSSQSMGESIPE